MSLITAAAAAAAAAARGQPAAAASTASEVAVVQAPRCQCPEWTSRSGQPTAPPAGAK